MSKNVCSNPHHTHYPHWSRERFDRCELCHAPLVDGDMTVIVWGQLRAHESCQARQGGDA